jgi:hypothetical protein
MIKLERTEVMNLENAIRGMRNPMNSWDKSDSVHGKIGTSDLALARKLVKSGTDHRKFLRQIFVSVDITAPLYWWKEYDTYKVGTVANSTSTMHKIHERRLTVEDFSHDRLSPSGLDFLEWSVIPFLNSRIERFQSTKEKADWDDIIQSLPSSYNQMRTCTMNYENLLNMVHSRRNHKLDEWHVFCDWAAFLPYFADMCL